MKMLNNFRTLFAVGMLASTLMITACAGTRVGAGYRVYDPYRRDYHTWDAGEGTYYTQWTIQTNRPRNREFRRLNSRERTEYWRWRHDRP